MEKKNYINGRRTENNTKTLKTGVQQEVTLSRVRNMLFLQLQESTFTKSE